VKLHVALAFGNMLVASAFGMLIGLNRLFGWLPWPPMSAAFAHAHLAAIGWAMMMVIGLSYRLIPMIVPAHMPTGHGLARSAVLLEVGVLALAGALLGAPQWTFAGALVILAGIASFVREVRNIVRSKMPSPAALPRPDWATWQTHFAFAWLLVAAGSGALLTLPIPLMWVVTVGWIYGTAGILGFLAQIVVGIQGRLLPLHAWYRQMELANMQPPGQSVHTLASPGLARAILIAWTLGVPALAGGVAASSNSLISVGSATLLVGVGLNLAQMLTVITRAPGPRLRRPSGPLTSSPSSYACPPLLAPIGSPSNCRR
jgi:hypothetical protein